MSDTVQSVDSRVSLQTAVSSSKKQTTDAQDVFAKMLSNMRQGAPATGYGDEEGSTLPDGTKITVMRQTLSDGSVLITIRAGEKIVSQTRTHPAKKEENPRIMHTETDLQGAAQHDRSITTIVQGDTGNLETLTERFNDTSATMTVGGSFSSKA